MPPSTSKLRRTRRAVLLVPVLALAVGLAGYLAHPSLRLAGSDAVQDPAVVSGSSNPGAPSEDPGRPPEPPGPAALSVGTAVDVLASPEAVAAALYDAYAAAVQVVPVSCHLPVSLLAAVGQAESGALVDVAAGPAALSAAAASTARSLCAGGRDLARPGDLRAALLDRVASPAYVRLVLTLESRYSGMGLGLLAVTGPVMVPLLIAAATARPMAPYAPVAAVFGTPDPRLPGTGTASGRPHQQPPLIPASASPTPAATLSATAAAKSPTPTPGVVDPTPVAASTGPEAVAGPEPADETAPMGDEGATTDPPAEADAPPPAAATEPETPAPQDPVDTPAADPTPACPQTPVTEPSTDPSPSPSDPTSPDPGTGTDPTTGDCVEATPDASAGPADTPAGEPTAQPDPASPPPDTVLP